MSTHPKIYGVIGNPISHSRSPLIHQTFAQQTGIPLTYSAILAPLDSFAATVDRFRAEGGLGLNVTVPFKHEAFAYCIDRSERALQAGAVNTLIFSQDPQAPARGDNTDGVGLMRDLAYHGIELTDKRILLLGAGGAARGVLGPLIAAHPANILVANRNGGTAKQLIQDFGADLKSQDIVTLCACALTDIPRDEVAFDLIINATSASLSGECPSLPDTVLQGHTIAYDMAYGTAPTVFMDWASARGARAVDGLGMLVEQAAESFYLWQGVYPQTEQVRARLRAELHSS